MNEESADSGSIRSWIKQPGITVCELISTKERFTFAPAAAANKIARSLGNEIRAIIDQRTGKFDPIRFRDRYQEALRELIEAKMKGLPIKPREVSTPAPVIADPKKTGCTSACFV